MLSRGGGGGGQRKFWKGNLRGKLRGNFDRVKRRGGRIYERVGTTLIMSRSFQGLINRHFAHLQTLVDSEFSTVVS